MRKIFISAGHSNKEGRDRGASGNGFIEGVLTVELRDLVCNELKKLGVTPIIDSNDSILSQTIAFFKNLVASESILLEVHWNASENTQAKGTETLIPKSFTTFERELAEALSKNVSDVLNIPLRGNLGVITEAESARGTLGWMRLNGENVLMEICFITNKDEMEKYQLNKVRLAREIAKTLVKFAGKGQELIHIVSSGETLSAIARRYSTTIEKIMLDNKLNISLINVGQRLIITK